MNFRLTGILALVAAVLGLLILFWDRDEDNDQARLERARRAFRFDPARVDRVLIEASGLAVECRRQDRHWQLVQPLVAPPIPSPLSACSAPSRKYRGATSSCRPAARPTPMCPTAWTNPLPPSR